MRLGDHAPTAPFPSLRGATTRLLLGGGDAARYRILILASGQPRRPRWAGLLLPPPVRLAAQPRGLMATRGGALEPVLYLPGSGVPLRCGGGAGGRGHGRGRELISGPGRATSDRTRDVLASGEAVPLTLFLRPGSAGSALQRGRSRRRVQRWGLGRAQGVQVVTAEGPVSQPPLGSAAGGEVRGSGRQFGSHPEPGGPLLPWATPFSFPLEPRLGGFVPRQGRGRVRGRGGQLAAAGA